ncbi:ATP-binding protein, partial [Marinibaculum pumilum]
LNRLAGLAGEVAAMLPEADLRLLAADPDHAAGAGDAAGADGQDREAAALPALWRAGRTVAGAPTWRAVGMSVGPGLPRLWIQLREHGGAALPGAGTGGAGSGGAASGGLLPAALAGLPVGAVLIDGEGTVLAANAAFAALSGLQNAEGRALADLVPEAEGEALRQLLSPAPAAQQAAGAEPATLHFAGSPDRSVQLIAGPGGDAEPQLVLALDVTAQKGVEQQVAHGQKMQAIGQLAGGVAHDFNNLLTAMIGFCDLLLQRHPPTDQSFADVQQIKQNALRAAGLVRQLLAFSRRQTLRPRPLDVGDVLADLRHLISRLIGERIRLTIVHGRNLGIVRVDRGQLEQVIINLAVNARDAMRDGGTLSITTSAEEIAAPLDRGSDRIPPGRYVRIDVADTGTGVPAEHADKIFDPFFTTKKQGEGTGLGLSTVYGIIRQTGGFVFLGRNGPDGATFSILLPEAVPEARDAGGAEGAEGVERPAPAPRDLTGRETLLLVEDEDAVRLFAARSLRNKGYTVMEAASGEAALELSRAFAGPIHALVTDVVMPNMDGPTLAQEVLRQRPGLAVVFMSGYAEDAVRQTLSGGELPSTFLQKPFTLNDLAVTVRAALGGAESARWPSKS